MLKQLINFYKVSSPRPCNGEALSSSGSQHLHSDARRLKYLKWSTFLSATFGYGMYYVCRLSLNVVKKPIVDEGIFSETELGIIGSVLFFTYALGKFTNGFLADRSNINRFMTTGLLIYIKALERASIQMAGIINTWRWALLKSVVSTTLISSFCLGAFTGGKP